MGKHVLVTGINGFVGHHLARALTKAGHTVSGVGYDSELLKDLEGIVQGYVSCDMTSTESCEANIKLDDIDAIIHLAGLANVGMSFDKPAKFINANTSMTVNLLDMVHKSGRDIRCVVISSGAVYDGNQEMPIGEDGKTSTGSPYAVSKLTTELAVQYYRGRGVDAVITRPFNHIGPGQGPGFLVPDLAYKIKAAQESGNSEISVGNISTKRDYTDVRDVAAAYTAIATADHKPEHVVYNVCSGVSHSGEEMLALIKEAMGAENMAAAVDESLLRPNDVMDIRGDNTRLSTEFSWSPTIALEQTINDFVTALR